MRRRRNPRIGWPMLAAVGVLGYLLLQRPGGSLINDLTGMLPGGKQPPVLPTNGQCPDGYIVQTTPTGAQFCRRMSIPHADVVR